MASEVPSRKKCGALHMMADPVLVDCILKTESAAAEAAAEAAAKAAAGATDKTACEAAANSAVVAAGWAMALEALWKAAILSGDWEVILNSFVAWVLVCCGYPPRWAKVASNVYAPSPAPVKNHEVPPPEALALLQTKARQRIRQCIRTETLRRFGQEHVTSDVIMRVGFYDAKTSSHVTHRMVIRLDDSQYPCNAAHFRLAAQNYALGHGLHKCFVLSGTRRPPPVVTLYHAEPSSSCVNCAAKSPIKLPECDIVYGEYTAPAASAKVIREVGTVLMYPRKVVPRDEISDYRAYDSPWFIVL